MRALDPTRGAQVGTGPSAKLKGGVTCANIIKNFKMMAAEH